MQNLALSYLFWVIFQFYLLVFTHFVCQNFRNALESLLSLVLYLEPHLRQYLRLYVALNLKMYIAHLLTLYITLHPALLYS